MKSPVEPLLEALSEYFVIYLKQFSKDEALLNEKIRELTSVIDFFIIANEVDYIKNFKNVDPIQPPESFESLMQEAKYQTIFFLLNLNPYIEEVQQYEPLNFYGIINQNLENSKYETLGTTHEMNNNAYNIIYDMMSDNIKILETYFVNVATTDILTENEDYNIFRDIYRDYVVPSYLHISPNTVPTRDELKSQGIIENIDGLKLIFDICQKLEKNQFVSKNASKISNSLKNFYVLNDVEFFLKNLGLKSDDTILYVFVLDNFRCDKLDVVSSNITLMKDNPSFTEQLNKKFAGIDKTYVTTSNFETIPDIAEIALKKISSIGELKQYDYLMIHDNDKKLSIFQKMRDYLTKQPENPKHMTGGGAVENIDNPLKIFNVSDRDYDALRQVHSVGNGKIDNLENYISKIRQYYDAGAASSINKKFVAVKSKLETDPPTDIKAHVEAATFFNSKDARMAANRTSSSEENPSPVARPTGPIPPTGSISPTGPTDISPTPTQKGSNNVSKVLLAYIGEFNAFITDIENKHKVWLQECENFVNYGMKIIDEQLRTDSTSSNAKNKIALVYKRCYDTVQNKALTNETYNKNFFVKKFKKKISMILQYITLKDSTDVNYSTVVAEYDKANKKIFVANAQFSTGLNNLLGKIKQNGIAALDEERLATLNAHREQTEKDLSNLDSKIKTFYNNKSNLMDLIFDSQFFLLYVTKALRILFSYISLFMATKIFTPIYENAVYDNKSNPPSLSKFLLIFLAFDVSLNAFLVVVLYLLKFMFGTSANGFPIDDSVIMQYGVDYGISIVVILLVSLLISGGRYVEKIFSFRV